MFTLMISPFTCETPVTSNVQVRFKPLLVVSTPTVRFDGEADGSTFLKDCAKAADAFESGVESMVVDMLGSDVTF